MHTGSRTHNRVTFVSRLRARTIGAQVDGFARVTRRALAEHDTSHCKLIIRLIYRILARLNIYARYARYISHRCYYRSINVTLAPSKFPCIFMTESLENLVLTAVPHTYVRCIRTAVRSRVRTRAALSSRQLTPIKA